MTFIAKLANGFAALCLFGFASTAWGVPHPLVLVATVGPCASHQVAAPSAVERQQQVEALLRQARKAMQDDKLELAEKSIRDAEQLYLPQDPLLAQLHDTPDKARRDLEQLKQNRSEAAPSQTSRPSTDFAQRISRSVQPPATDPFAARRGQATSSLSETTGKNSSAAVRAPNKTTEEPFPRSTPFSGDLIRSHPNGNQREPASTAVSNQNLLLEARRALARGDVPAARDLTVTAARTGNSASLLGDSPEKIDALIRTFQELQSKSVSQTPGHSHAYSRLLMDQAAWLLHYRDYDLAESLARKALSLQVEYRPFERTPGQLLAQIVDQRNTSASQPAVESTSVPADTQTGASPKDGARQSSSSGPSDEQIKVEALQWAAKAQQALDSGEIKAAENYIRRAIELKVPDSRFGPNELRPWELLLRIDREAKHRRPAAVDPREAVQRPPTSRAVFEPKPERTGELAAQFQDSAPAIGQVPGGGETNPPAYRQYEQGMRALEEFDSATALKHFREAWKHQEQLDERTRQLVQEKLNVLQIGEPRTLPDRPRSTLEQAVDEQELALQKLQREVYRERETAQSRMSTDPRGSLEKLRQLRDRVGEAGIDAAMQKHLLTLVDRSIVDLERYIEQHASEIENSELNQRRQAEVDARRRQQAEIDDQLAALVDNFNKMMDENRFAEAEVIARQARELDSENPVVQNLLWKSRFARRLQAQMVINDRSEQGLYEALESVDESKIPFDDRVPLKYGDVTKWRELSKSRTDWLREQSGRLSPSELKIQQSLTQEQVNVRFVKQPLREVMDILSASVGVNIHLDPRGLHAEGVTSDTPVTLNLNQAISLKSALNLILEPLNLSYVVQNEVIKVTSVQLRDENVYPQTYYVADLVIPIPNFVPSYNMGLPGALAHAHNSIGYGNTPASGSVPLTVAANSDAINAVTNNPQVLANLGQDGLIGTARSPRPLGYGPGGLGGGSLADFDSLIDLVTTTISPESWDDVGGPGTISPFEANLSLVISQTQEVHEQIADLLQQLRRLQDLQVTIEVRFITLNDDFFERVGVDFDFEIRDKTGQDPTLPIPENETFIVGLDPTGAPTADLDLVFNQGSFGSSIPQFGGFDAATAANFGFAILSDLEVFLLLQASTGDQRTNIMQAPKVTLFNGQTAIVSDTAQQPFVTSVVPVVGDFAAAHQPVIVVLSEGTSLSVQAVVSADRRFVRLTLVPFFSSIGDVQEFTFNGKRVVNPSGTGGNSGNSGGSNNPSSDIIEGTTVQLPQFSFTTVTTTVSVPDGGTVLMGGIKRLSEGRTERGVPLLSKVPYINRLFKNVGIGREAQSLMMMVTPRIIIQEEEELEQTGLDSSQL